MDYKEKYEIALERAKNLISYKEIKQEDMEYLFPELKKSEDELTLTWLTKYIEEEAYNLSMDIRDNEDRIRLEKLRKSLAWLEKRGNEPNFCHHEVDLSNCSEEYRKAYYDGWNNCNMQHSQCKSESDDVVKCLINGMKFYYEDNEEATWGTEKFSMKVKDILSWLEKQSEPIKDDDEVDSNEDGLIADTTRYKNERQGEQKPIIEMKSPKESLGISPEEYNKMVAYILKCCDYENL